MRRKVLAAALVAVGAGAIALLLGQRTVQDETPALPVDQITVAYPEEPANLNPYLYEGDSNASRDLLRPVLPTLLQVNPELRYQPSLAIRVPSGDDIESNPFRVTFHLDPEARWSDGTPITAQDVKFTWETIRSEKNPVADRSAYQRVIGFRSTGATTFTLEFDQPYPAWRDLFSSGDFILPKHNLEGQEFGGTMADGPSVSGGPYLIESRTKGLEVVYRMNPQWWRRRPAAQRIRVQFVPDIDTAVQLLEDGRVDVVAATTQIGLSKSLGRLGGVKVSSRFGSAWWELAFIHGRAGPKDVNWRGAVAAGFNRHGFVEALLKEDGKMLEHLRPGRPSVAAFAMWRHDPERAKALLPKEGENRFIVGAPGENGMAQLLEKSLQAGMKPLGIFVEPSNPRTDAFYSIGRRSGTFDLAFWERRGSPSLPFDSYFHSERHPPGGLNYSLLASKEVDDAISKVEGSPNYLRSSSDRLMSALGTSLPVLPLFEAKAYLAYRANLTGMEANATIDGPFWNLDEWGTLR